MFLLGLSTQRRSLTVSILTTYVPLQKEASPSREPRAARIHGCTHKYLKGSLATWAFSQTLIVGSFPDALIFFIFIFLNHCVSPATPGLLLQREMGKMMGKEGGAEGKVTQD